MAHKTARSTTDDDLLLLDRQLCFPLYACSKEVVRRYAPLLEPLGLTYTPVSYTHLTLPTNSRV